MLQKYLLIFFVLFAIILTIPFSTHALTPTATENSTDILTVTPPKKSEGLGPVIKKAVENRLPTLKAKIELRQQLHEQEKDKLKIKLETFKDQNKKNRILKLDTKIASISAKRVERMGQAVDKLEKILDTIKNKADALTDCDKTDLAAAIEAAREAISSASATVDAQANKTYSIEISDEETAKVQVGQTLKQLQQDLRNTHQTVMKAKLAVVKAAVTFRKARQCIKTSVFPTNQPTINPTINPSVTLILSPSVTLTPTGQ